MTLKVRLGYGSKTSQSSPRQNLGVARACEYFSLHEILYSQIIPLFTQQGNARITQANFMLLFC